MKYRPTVLNAILFTACLGASVMWWKSYKDLTRLRFEISHEYDADVEEAAFQLEAQKEHLPLSKLKELLFPVTIRFSDRRCVELRPRWGVFGGTSVHCFNEQGERVSYEQIGE